MFKRLILVILFCCSAANAGTVATAVNTVGGIIVLTDVRCDGRKTLTAYTTNSRGNTMFGCWFIDENFVFIQWSDGDVRTYPIGIWTTTNQKKQEMY